MYTCIYIFRVYVCVSQYICVVTCTALCTAPCNSARNSHPHSPVFATSITVRPATCAAISTIICTATRTATHTVARLAILVVLLCSFAWATCVLQCRVVRQHMVTFVARLTCISQDVPCIAYLCTSSRIQIFCAAGAVDTWCIWNASSVL